MPSIAQVLRQGLAADKPTPDATLNQGWIWYETDTGLLRQSWNGTWVTINSPRPAGSADFVKLGDIVAPAGGQQSFTFPGIPGGFNYLHLIAVGRTDGSDAGAHVVAQFNGDTNAANYLGQLGTFENYAGGTAAATYPLDTSQPGIKAGQMGGTDQDELLDANVVELFIPDYANTTRYKAAQQRAMMLGSTDYEGTIGTSWWKNTAAITDIVFKCVTNKLIEGSRVSLYAVS